MRKVKDVAGTATTPETKRVRKTAMKSVAPRRPRARVAAKPKPPASIPAPDGAESSISEDQAHVVASKFVRSAVTEKKKVPRPSLPMSYGESHLLLLVRDPQTLFAAWDMGPATVEPLKARIGSRAFAVSNLTLRLTRAGGGTSVFHLGKRARSRYLKVEGGPSFIAEIGFTTPAGRFELAARSAPCFLPMGTAARQESMETVRRAVLGYREARALARRGLVASAPARAGRGRSTPPSDSATAPADPQAPRVLGGASDLYRR